jgi:hypothetical protein
MLINKYLLSPMYKSELKLLKKIKFYYYFLVENIAQEEHF